MKLNYNYMVLALLLVLCLTGCSKDEASSVNTPDESQSATITFQALLDNLANRSMNKAHFDQVPTCSDGVPEIAVIGIEYGSESKTVVVDILEDEEGYFTAYSEDLKVPVPSDGTTTVTVTSFMVYDGATDGDETDMYYSSDYGNLIWIAPISTDDENEDQFAGYVDNPIPYSFELSPGTKPYIPIDVLCFDRRMVNEYGYVFFDIDQKEIFNFCLFGNYCTPSGRHYVANYSIDVWLGDDNTGIQIYDGLISEAVDSNNDGIYEESPLCIGLPDDPDTANEEYYFEITLRDSPEYDAGDDEGRVVLAGVLTEEEAKNLFVGDSMLEYYHFQVGNCGESDTPPIFNDPEDETMRYKSCLGALNGSEAVIFAYAKLEGNYLTTEVWAPYVPSGEHMQHLHGSADDTFISSCPDESDDANNDGYIDINEGLSDYGLPQLFLTTSGATNASGGTWPSGSSYMYSRTVTLGSADTPSKAAMTPLDRKTVVVHGMMVDGTFDPSMPIACGQLELNN
ncbi:MAG: hypothetical protein ABGW91_03695 [Christiangramia sp.]